MSDPEVVRLRGEVQALSYEIQKLKEQEAHNKQKIERLIHWAREQDRGLF